VPPGGYPQGFACREVTGSQCKSGPVASGFLQDPGCTGDFRTTSMWKKKCYHYVETKQNKVIYYPV
jgi:hypothetical protein